MLWGEQISMRNRVSTSVRRSPDDESSCAGRSEHTSKTLVPGLSIGFPGLRKCSLALGVLLASLLLAQVGAPAAEPSCAGLQVEPGDDLDAIVNADSASEQTTFCIKAGTYNVDNTIKIESGDKLLGEPGTLRQRGPALDPNPVVRIVNVGDLPRVIHASGTVLVQWLDVVGSLSGARYTDDSPATCTNWGEASNRCPENGTGVGIGAGTTTPDSVFRYLELHNNAANCITGVSGRLVGSDLYRCSGNADYWGYAAGALKTIYEAEVTRNFVHNNQAVGLWCDQGCRNTPERTRGYWVHRNLVVNNGRAGIRYEFSPMPGSPSRSTALVEYNRLAGNRYGGADVHDAQNATFRGNIFGPQRVYGVAYRGNGAGEHGLQFSDSGRTERTDLRNSAAVYNRMNGETIGGCHKPDRIVYCKGNVFR